MNVHFLTLGEAVRSSEGLFFGSIENATRDWIASASKEEIEAAFFDYRVVDNESLLKAA